MYVGAGDINTLLKWFNSQVGYRYMILFVMRSTKSQSLVESLLRNVALIDGITHNKIALFLFANSIEAATDLHAPHGERAGSVIYPMVSVGKDAARLRDGSDSEGNRQTYFALSALEKYESHNRNIVSEVAQASMAISSDLCKEFDVDPGLESAMLVFYRVAEFPFIVDAQGQEDIDTVVDFLRRITSLDDALQQTLTDVQSAEIEVGPKWQEAAKFEQKKLAEISRLVEKLHKQTQAICEHLRNDSVISSTQCGELHRSIVKRWEAGENTTPSRDLIATRVADISPAKKDRLVELMKRPEVSGTLDAIDLTFARIEIAKKEIDGKTESAMKLIYEVLPAKKAAARSRIESYKIHLEELDRVCHALEKKMLNRKRFANVAAFVGKVSELIKPAKEGLEVSEKLLKQLGGAKH